MNEEGISLSSLFTHFMIAGTFLQRAMVNLFWIFNQIFKVGSDEIPFEGKGNQREDLAHPDLRQCTVFY